jgi:formiminotetrahydrofolate cyclodeaminase
MTTGEMTVASFLDALAAKQSTPGGGGAAALTGAQAAALVSMVINFTLGNKKYAAVETFMQQALIESEALRAELLDQADRDVAAFAAVAECYAMPKVTDAEKEARTTALQSALQGAARVPLATAEKCVAVLALAGKVGAEGNVNVVSDAAVAIYLAEAALRSAVVNVNINLKFIKDAAFVHATGADRDALLSRAATLVIEGKQACHAVLGIDL